MTAKITIDVIESHLRCKLKAHLKLAGAVGNKCDYERLLVDTRAEVRLRAITKILTEHSEGEVMRDVPLTVATLSQGPVFVLDAALEDEALSLRFDGLMKVEGTSTLGDFHYIPVLFHESRKLGKELRLLLELYGLLLAGVQGKAPAHGIIWHGRDCQATRVKLNPDPRKAEQLLRDLKEMAAREVVPPLLLNSHCQVCEFRQRCHEHAVKEDNLSLLRGMSEKEVKGYSRKGILTVTQFAHTFRPRRKPKRHMQKPHRRYHALQAMAIGNKKIYVFGTPELPDSPVLIYLDVESDPDEGFVYLIGMTVVQDGTQTSYSFWADTREQEIDIFEQFLAEVRRHDDFKVFCYGSYERDFLKRMRTAAKDQGLVDRVLDRLVNALSLVYAHVYFPTYSNGLKDVALCLGCRWSEADASVFQSIVWRKRWEATRAEEWKQVLFTYNLEDCAALSKVVGFLYAVQSEASPSGPQGTEVQAVPPVTRVDDLKPHPTRRTWCTATFVIPEFAEINECAYFDYQRDKVFIRTNKTLARASRRRTKDKGARQLPIDKRIEFTVEECSSCQSKRVIPLEGRGRRKVIYDLKFSSRGISRRVIECVDRPARCARCSTISRPDKVDRVAKYQHGLRSWVIFEHVNHRVSFEKIGNMLEDYFGFRVGDLFLQKFKDLMARYYQSTYDNLLKRIIAGDLLHADETTIETKTEEGYVWVLTNLEEVVYMYKPTREGTFLHDLLKGFTGVLVSDFFSAYDSLPCAQQKCLIHLIRDLNHDLFHSPYDDELKAIASQFGQVLKPIIQTVDQRGLRSAYLVHHKRAVDRLFNTLSEGHYTSEVALGYQARFVKNRNKLFTFLDHDGVPWNNNNAEHAIKQFAYYRQICEPHISVAGLQEYLVLLSIAQTCKYKGVSFLKFLLSRELDIDAFCKRPRRQPPAQPPDLYPPGFSVRRFGDRKIYED